MGDILIWRKVIQNIWQDYSGATQSVPPLSWHSLKRAFFDQNFMMALTSSVKFFRDTDDSG